MRRPNHAVRWIAAGVSVLALSGAGAAVATTEPPDDASMDTEAAADTTMGTAATGDTSMAGGSTPMSAGPSDCPPITAAADGSAAPAGSDAAGTEPAGTDAMSTAPSDTGLSDTGMADSAATATDAPGASASPSASTGNTMVDVSAPPMSGPFVQIVETDEYGPILVDANCRTLYVFTPDEAGAPTCEEECATKWPPLFVADGEVPPLADELDPTLFSVVEHVEGPMLAVAGWPLYYYAEDLEPGEINGQGVGGVWWVVSPEGTMIESEEGGDATTADGSEAPMGSGPMESGPMESGPMESGPMESEPMGSAPVGTVTETTSA